MRLRSNRGEGYPGSTRPAVSARGKGATSTWVSQMSLQRSGILLVVSGPSGVGKGTLIAGVRRRHPEVRLSVSCTTRPPRAGEQEGVDYYFVSAEEFDRLCAQGCLLEWAEVYPGLRYGTPRKPVEEALARGEDIVLEIDDQGAHSVRRVMGERAVLVFVAPPSFAELRRRLADRNTESEEQLQARLATARQEISHLGDYDHVIINDQIEPATAELEAVLLAARSARRAARWEALRDRLLAEADALLQRGAEVASDA